MAKDYALSREDIINAFDGKVKVVLYSEIKKYKTIKELLSPYGKVVILYFWRKFFGHWICVFKNVNGNVEVFDSLGSWIDDNLKDINKSFRKETDQDYKYLTKLLYDCDCDVEYNDVKLQGNKSTTCGRWVTYRLRRDDLTIEEFQDLFKNKKNKDKEIILLTDDINDNHNR